MYLYIKKYFNYAHYGLIRFFFLFFYHVKVLTPKLKKASTFKKFLIVIFAIILFKSNKIILQALFSKLSEKNNLYQLIL